MKKKNTKRKTFYIVVATIFLLCILVFLYNLLFAHKVKYTRDVLASTNYEILPDDELIVDYDSYKNFIKKNLKNSEYQKEISNTVITHDLFDKYDYIAIFYNARLCSSSNRVKSISKFKNKIVLSVRRVEDSKCDLETRILLVPVDKDKYKTLPNVVIKKEIIEK